MPVTLYLRQELRRPLSVQELDANFKNLRAGITSGGGLRLEDLLDVSVSGVTDGQTIVYNSVSQTWVNSAGGLAQIPTLQQVTTQGNTTTLSIGVAGITSTGSIVFNSGASVINPTVNLSASAGNDLLIQTADVLALSANNIVLGGNAATQANVQGQLVISNVSPASIQLPTSGNIGLGVGYSQSTTPQSSLHLKANAATLRVESTQSAVATQIRIQDPNTAFMVGIRANTLGIYQQPSTSSSDQYIPTEADMLLSWHTSNKKVKLSTNSYGTVPGYLTMNTAGYINLDTAPGGNISTTVTLTGDITGDGPSSGVPTALANVGIAGTYTKVITDAKGRVITGANINGLDVTTALGYIPVNRAGDTMQGDLVLHSSAPATPFSAVPKTYVDALLQGLTMKQAVRLVATTNQTLSGNTTVDGVLTVTNDRVLLTAQTDATQNGPWVTAPGGWTRPLDFDADADVVNGAYWLVREGTVYHDTGWVLITDAVIQLGSTQLVVQQFSAPTTLQAGTGLTKTGNTISLSDTGVIAGSYGTFGQHPTFSVNQQGQLVTANTINTGYAQLFGDTTTGPFTLTHGLQSTNVKVEIFDVVTGETVYPKVQRTSSNAIQISGFMTAVPNNQYKALVYRVI